MIKKKKIVKITPANFILSDEELTTFLLRSGIRQEFPPLPRTFKKLGLEHILGRTQFNPQHCTRRIWEFTVISLP